MLDYRIDTFLEVCKWSNYTKAAKALCITQPAVSQHIAFLEKEYGAKLFTYEGKKLTLTDAGEMLYHASATMKHDAFHIKEQMKQYDKKEKLLKLGATMTIGEFDLPDRLTAYLNAHPEYLCRMHISNTADLLEQMNRGEIDFAFVEGYFEKEEYDFFSYSHENYIAVAQKTYVFQKKPDCLQSLFSEPLILREKGSGTREILERALQLRNLTVDDFAGHMEVNNINVIKHFTMAGKGITFLYEKAVEKELQEGSLIKLPLEDFQLAHDFYFVWRKNSVFSGYYKNLFQELMEKESLQDKNTGKIQ